MTDAIKAAGLDTTPFGGLSLPKWQCELRGACAVLTTFDKPLSEAYRQRLSDMLGEHQNAILALAAPPQPEGVEELVERNARLEQWMAEIQMNAHKWMVAHDRLKAGKPYDLPTPADLPDTVKALQEALETLVGFLGQKRVRLANKDLVLGHAREALARLGGVGDE